MFLLVKSLLPIVLILICEKIWFSFSGEFLKDQLSQIALIKDNEFDIRIDSAILTYLVMSFSISYFVFTINFPDSLIQAISRGFLLGLVIYGVFDLTNRTILTHYSWKLVIVDMIWGTMMYSFVSGITFFVLNQFNRS